MLYYLIKGRYVQLLMSKPSNLTPLSQFVLHPFSSFSVTEALKTINAKKTTEDHLDPFFFIKTYAPLIIDSIIYIFNQVFLMA